jgi:hypothetical protein
MFFCGLLCHFLVMFTHKWELEKFEVFFKRGFLGIFVFSHDSSFFGFRRCLNMAASTSADDIRQALIAASQNYTGVTGDKTFDASGDGGAVYGRWTVKDGQITDYK